MVLPTRRDPIPEPATFGTRNLREPANRDQPPRPATPAAPAPPATPATHNPQPPPPAPTPPTPAHRRKPYICQMAPASPQRYIAHFDLDAFFVSVECINDPSLKGKPLLVGGHSERGVVAACSYEARKYGIHSAMPMKTALRLCPHATVVGNARGEYSKYSRWVTEIIAAKAPLFEKASIDEFYLDLTGMDRYYDPWKWTIDLREEITNATKLPISFALASNKMISKIATQEAKPNGYIQVPPGMERELLAPLAVNKIPGVGEQTFQAMKEMSILTIRDLSERPMAELERRFGK